MGLAGVFSRGISLRLIRLLSGQAGGLSHVNDGDAGASLHTFRRRAAE